MGPPVHTLATDLRVYDRYKDSSTKDGMNLVAVEVRNGLAPSGLYLS
jgi:hypothetical protein